MTVVIDGFAWSGMVSLLTAARLVDALGSLVVGVVFMLVGFLALAWLNRR